MRLHKHHIWSAVALGCALCASVFCAGETQIEFGKFKITQTTPIISTATISGKEDYKIASTSEGFSITSTLWVANGEIPVFSQVEETLKPDWTLKHYTFHGTVGGIQQKIEAWVDGNSLHMQVASGEASPHRVVELRPNAVVLDNFVPSNFQVLLNLYARSGSAGPMDVYMVVPQRLLALKATFARAADDTGDWGGKQVKLAKYLLHSSAGTTQIWADAENHVLGVYFDQPDIEYLQAGFDLPQLTLAMRKTFPQERHVSFPSHGRMLLASLMLPPENLGKKDKYPLVVMVPGFGPVDRDETIGKNKPMRDLAEGLARHGIASLRYDKPAYSFYGKIDVNLWTIEEDSIDCAAAAIRYARSLPEADAGNIFVLGHSQGGAMAPFIVDAAGGGVRGLVVLAVPARPPDKLVPDQVAVHLRARNTSPQEVEAQSERLRREFAAIRNGSAPDSTMVLGYSAHYWRSLMARNVIAEFHKVDMPVLLLQGGRDVQVAPQDYEQLSAAVPAKFLENHLYPMLNHIFTPAPEGANGSEMVLEAKVADEVIENICAWLEKHKTHAAESQVAAAPSR